MNPHPPRLARWLLERFVPENEPLAGDLIEEFASGILSWPERLRRGWAHDRHRCRTRPVGIFKFPTRPKANAHRAKVVGADGRLVHVEPVRRDPALQLKIATDGHVAEGQPIDDAGRLDAIERLQSPQHVPVEPTNPRGLWIALRGQIDRRREHALRREPGVNRTKLQKGLQHQPRAGQQHKGQGDLDDDQYAMKTAAASGDGAIVRDVPWAWDRRLERWQHTDT